MVSVVSGLAHQRDQNLIREVPPSDAGDEILLDPPTGAPPAPHAPKPGTTYGPT